MKKPESFEEISWSQKSLQTIFFGGGITEKRLNLNSNARMTKYYEIKLMRFPAVSLLGNFNIIF